MDNRTAALAQLREYFGPRLVEAEGARSQYAQGEGSVCGILPDAVFAPETTEETAAAVRTCAAYGLPVVPFGAGTSLEGQVDSVVGGLTLDLKNLDRILGVDPSALDVHVEAGVTREQLNVHLRDTGLFFPPDPGANATLGGMASTRASGTNAVRYGTMRELTLGLTVVTADGSIVETGSRSRKSSTGYDLTHLFVGAEGTLGVITELRLRVFGIPETSLAGVAQFATTEQAIAAVTTVLQLGVPVARVEFLSSLQVAATASFSRLEGVDRLPTLLIEVHGSAASVELQRDDIAEILESSGARRVRWAEDRAECSRLWKARHDAYWAARALRPGSEVITTDACVPLSALAEAITQAEELAADSKLCCPVIGHVGDGNFHMMILYDPSDRERAETLATAISRVAITLGGTASGEHGIGRHRREILPFEHGAGVELMKTIKQALDPTGIMNPGKLVG